MINSAAPLYHLRVLAIDDEMEFLEKFDKIIDSFGHKMTGHVNPQEAVKEAREAYNKRNGFDVAFIDYLMPDLNGVEISRELKAIDPNMILIAITRDETIKTKMLIIDSLVFRLLISKSISLLELENLFNILVSTKIKQSSGKETGLSNELLADQHKARKKKEAKVAQN